MPKFALALTAMLVTAVGLASGISLASSGGTREANAGVGPELRTEHVELNLLSDVCGHDQYIFPRPPNQPPPHNLTLELTLFSDISISGPPPWVGVVSTPGANGTITASGIGTVAGISNVVATFTFTLSDNGLSGTYTFGSNGALPDCNGKDHPAVYQVKPKRPTPTATTPPTPVFPPANGSCTEVAQDILIGAVNYDRWNCTGQDSNAHFRRVDIAVESLGVDTIEPEHPPIFVCPNSDAGEQVAGSLKGFREGVNPGAYPNDDIWSGEFTNDCTAGQVTVYLHSHFSIHVNLKGVAFGEAFPTSTPTATEILPPTPVFPNANGGCNRVRTDVPIDGTNYDEWQCSEHDINFHFNRVDIAFESDGAILIDEDYPPLFRCQSGLGSQQVDGTYKGYRPGANQGPHPDDFIYSGEFPAPCTEGGASVYVHSADPSDPAYHAVVKRVAFTTVTIPTATATPAATSTPPPPQASPTVTHTATLPPPTATRTPTWTPIRVFTPIKLCGDVNDDHRVNSLDATLIEQYDSGLLTRPVIIRLPNLPSGDTNFDGRINSIDASIDLQIDARILDHCGEVM